MGMAMIPAGAKAAIDGPAANGIGSQRGTPLLCQRAIAVSTAPSSRPPRERYWYVLNRPDVEVCVKDYGFDVDLFVMAGLMALTQIHLGRLDILHAMDEGLVEVDGRRDLCYAFPRWMGINHFAQSAVPCPPAVLRQAKPDYALDRSSSGVCAHVLRADRCPRPIVLLWSVAVTLGLVPAWQPWWGMRAVCTSRSWPWQLGLAPSWNGRSPCSRSSTGRGRISGLPGNPVDSTQACPVAGARSHHRAPVGATDHTGRVRGWRLESKGDHPVCCCAAAVRRSRRRARAAAAAPPRAHFDRHRPAI